MVANRIKFIREHVQQGPECGGIRIANDMRRRVKPMAKRIAARHRLARLRAGAGGALRIGAVGGDLCGRGHEMYIAKKRKIYVFNR